MTREEAMQMIQNDLKLHHDYLSGDYRKALHMAIEALSREPSEDVISRQAAIDLINGWFNRIGLNGDICVDGLRQLPSAQPEIIRCRDCKHWKHDHTCHEHSLVSPMMANEFCSRAERREEP